MTRPLTYLDGIGTGVAVVAVAVACWLARASHALGALYRDFGDVALPATTRLVLSPAWYAGIPVVLTAAGIALHLWRPRFGLVALAAAAVAIDVAWYVLAYAPIHALAGNIR